MGGGEFYDVLYRLLCYTDRDVEEFLLDTNNEVVSNPGSCSGGVRETHVRLNRKRRGRGEEGREGGREGWRRRGEEGRERR